MTIYYDNKDDIEHQITKDQAKDLRLASAHQTNFGVLSFILGNAIHSLSTFREKPSELGKWAGVFAMVAGGLEVMKAYFTGRQAHDLELKAARTVEPQRILLDQPAVYDIPAPRAECCDKPKFLEGIKPQSLLEHSEPEPSTGIIQL